MKPGYQQNKLGILALLLLLITIGVLAACGNTTPANIPATTSAATINASSGARLQGTIRLGFFPNLTHAQALVGIGSGAFAQALGSDVKLETTAFNAGPAEMEALLAGDIDIGYVGPNPPINSYIKSKGQSVRIIAGAASGGVSLVVRPDSNINTAKDLAGKKIATPQLGNTQDVALRSYIKQNGLETTDKGGNVEVVPTDNANILQLFANKQIDGAWVPEPWATRLVVESKGRVFLDESSLWPDGKFIITLIAVNTKFLNEKPALVKAFLAAHLQVTQTIQKDPVTAKQVINDQLKALSGKALAPEILNASFDKIQLVTDPLKSSALKAANDAYAAGFLGKDKPNLDNLFDLKILNSLLTEKGLPTIS